MNTKNTASQPKAASIADDAKFLEALHNYFTYGDEGSKLLLFTYLDSKLRAPADQAASVAGVVKLGSHGKFVQWSSSESDLYTLPVGTKLYFAPQQSLAPAAEGQVSAVAPAELVKLLSAADDALAEGNRGTSGRLILDRYSEESLREAVAKIRASEGQAQTSAAVWQVQIRVATWISVTEWDCGHTVTQVDFPSYDAALPTLNKMEGRYEEHEFRIHRLAAQSADKPTAAKPVPKDAKLWADGIWRDSSGNTLGPDAGNGGDHA